MKSLKNPDELEYLQDEGKKFRVNEVWEHLKHL